MRVAYAPTPLTVTGGLPGYKFKLAGGSLPAGMSLKSTGILQGTPKTAGSFRLTVSATDKLKTVATRDFVLVVTG